MIRGSANDATSVFLLGNDRSAVPRMGRFSADLRAAGIEPGKPQDGVADFHALRATFATSLARADVPLVLALARIMHEGERQRAG
jgi:hypothetical protein